MLDQLMSITKDPATTKITTQRADIAASVGGAASEGTFSHVFSTMAIQVLPDPAGEGTLVEWARLLQPDGIVAIGIWDFDENCGPHALWAEAAKAVDPNYVNPPLLLLRHWSGRAQLEEGLKKEGLTDFQSEVMHLWFDVGKEGFMRFFWESGNPMPKDRQSSPEGDLGKPRLRWKEFWMRCMMVGPKCLYQQVWQWVGNRKISEIVSETIFIFLIYPEAIRCLVLLIF